MSDFGKLGRLACLHHAGQGHLGLGMHQGAHGARLTTLRDQTRFCSTRSDALLDAALTRLTTPLINITHHNGAPAPNSGPTGS